MLLQSLADAFAFFVPFEKNISFWYLLVFLLSFLYLIFKNRKTIFSLIKNRLLIVYVAVTLIVAVIFIGHYSPFSDHLDSRSEDYKLAAKYYAQKQKYSACRYGQGDDCFMESQMEKAPGYPFLLSLFYRGAGISSDKAILFNFVIALCIPILLVLSIYITTNNVFTSFLSSLLFALNKDFIAYSTQTSVMNITIFFVALSFFFMSVYYKSKKKDIIFLVLYSLLFLGYMRAEYILFLAIFCIFNIKDIANVYKKTNKYLFYLFIILSLFSILHFCTEMAYHTAPDGRLFLFSAFPDRLIENINIFLFQNHFIILAFFFLFSIRNISAKKFAFYPLIHLIVFIPLILLFQNDGVNRYSVALLPSLFIIIGIGSNNFLKSKYLNKRFYKKMKYVLIVFVYVFFFLLSLPYHRYSYYDNSTECFDDLIGGLDNGLLFFPNQPLLSRTLLETNLTGAVILSPGFVKQISNSISNSQPKYLVRLNNEYHLKTADMALENFKTKLKVTKGKVALYEIIN